MARSTGSATQSISLRVGHGPRYAFDWQQLAAKIARMVEIKNSIGQTLLRLEKNEVKNLMGQTIGTTRNHQLMNLQGQVLAEVRDGKVYRGGEAHLLEIRGGEILNASGQPIASVDGGDDAQRGLLGAAFLVFCPSWVEFLLHGT